MQENTRAIFGVNRHLDILESREITHDDSPMKRGFLQRSLNTRILSEMLTIMKSRCSFMHPLTIDLCYTCVYHEVM
jgi:hypothetical protein